MTTMARSPSPGAGPFPVYDDDDVDDMASVEFEYGEVEPEPKPYVGSYTRRNASGITSTSFISSLPSELSIASKPALPANNVDPRYAPRRDRPPFRSPASVRAMQMSSPPPLLAHDASRERLRGSYKLATPSGRTGRSDTVSTTGSRPSKAQRDSVHSDYQALQSPRGTPTPQSRLPLVLLHVTILPTQLPYAHEFILDAMPEWLVENYRVLAEKLQDVVMMRRGILISHPGDEYDLLEERILESLELKAPRLLKCGHFLGADECVAEETLDDREETNLTDISTGRGSRMSGGTVTADEEAEWSYSTPLSDDVSMCADCHRHVTRPGLGVGTGTKRWDLKIYAANGLMRAGAWSAAWNEMERCDVEIAPWIPDDIRKDLDKRLQKEREAAQRKQMYAAELELQIAREEALRKKDEEEAKQRAEQVVLQSRAQAEAAFSLKALQEEAEERKRLGEALLEKIEEAKETVRLEFETQALTEANSIAERLRAIENALKRQEKTAIDTSSIGIVPTPPHEPGYIRSRDRSSSRRPAASKIPLGTLLKNYLYLLFQDTRNNFIVILTGIVVFFVAIAATNWQSKTTSLEMSHNMVFGHMADVLPPVVVTSTVTIVATSTTTSVGTETQQASGMVVEALAKRSVSLHAEFENTGTRTQTPGSLVPSQELPFRPAPNKGSKHKSTPKIATDSQEMTQSEQTSAPIILFLSYPTSDAINVVHPVAKPEPMSLMPSRPTPKRSTTGTAELDHDMTVVIIGVQDSDRVVRETLNENEH